ncbi:uncharacterized protein [Aphelocoma coerulescens]|uniref:uncharacterized protein n=1 Tax=Aphelocoma coerulescens TaxID=39617 RepID=UPI00360454DC
MCPRLRAAPLALSLGVSSPGRPARCLLPVSATPPPRPAHPSPPPSAPRCDLLLPPASTPPQPPLTDLPPPRESLATAAAAAAVTCVRSPGTRWHRSQTRTASGGRGRARRWEAAVPRPELGPCPAGRAGRGSGRKLPPNNSQRLRVGGASLPPLRAVQRRGPPHPRVIKNKQPVASPHGPPQQTARVKKRVTFLLCVLPARLPAGGRGAPQPPPLRLPARAEGPLPAAPSGRPAPRCPGAPPLAWEEKRRGAEVPVG